jgi:hypothetical protein
LANQPGISYETCQHILTDKLNMRWIMAKFVPRVLTDDQKHQCINVCCDRQEQVQNDPTILSKIIAGDET